MTTYYINTTQFTNLTNRIKKKNSKQLNKSYSLRRGRIYKYFETVCRCCCLAYMGQLPQI